MSRQPRAASTSASPPSLMYSSGSGPASSPPSTPPARRYPAALSKTPSAPAAPRVPLHRRGTSRTYERMEDLLREAGYKETRVVTPQKGARGSGDDVDEDEHEGAEEEEAGAKAGVMKFLSGLVGAGKGKERARESWSVPASPDGARRTRALVAEPAPMRAADYAPSHAQPPRRPQTAEHAPRPRKPPSYRLPPERPPPRTGYADHGQSPAHTMLRHMASAPAIARTQSDRGARRPRAHATEPPLPATWLESVARALLGQPAAPAGGPPEREAALPSVEVRTPSGAYAQDWLDAQSFAGGQERPGTSLSASSSGRTVRPSALSRSNSARLLSSSRTNSHSNLSLARQNSGSALAYERAAGGLARKQSTLSGGGAGAERERGRGRPPALLLLGASPAAPAAASASKTHVVCRSAPGSRAASRMREPTSAELGSVRGLRRAQDERGGGALYPAPKARAVPARRRSAKERGGAKAAGLSLAGRAEDEAFAWSEGAPSSSESDGGEGELDLGRLLRAGSPRRQASVASLRRNLGEAGVGGGEGRKARRRRDIPKGWVD